MSNLKISLLTNMVTPYRVPFFKEMASDENISRFRVLTCVDKECDREWLVNNKQDYQVKRLSGVTLNLKAGKDARRIMHFRFGILWELIRHRPDKLIIGDASWTSFIAVFACQLLSIPYIVWNEITTTSKVSEGMVAKLRNYMYHHATHLIASCKMAQEYLCQCGVNPSQISIVNNAVDNDLFLAHKAELTPQRDNIRARLGIAPDAFCFLYVGQLISRKRVIETLELLAKASTQTQLHFVVAGTGPLEQEMRSKATELDFSDINFCGFVQDKGLSELYVAADSLILLSEDEPWGMVVNEVLLFNKKVVSTDSVAATVEFYGTHDVYVETIDNIDEKYLQFVIKAKGLKNTFSYSVVDMSSGFLDVACDL
ncbi:glycosyltransferase family 4 protein [Vibrio cyclitrophicus]|uniref:glycosyltransferase family 4 protein n=1 Tax=Vibrio cyclitrophicus TaxID=47951 RepID=UPI00148D95D1|nr:glycosyltransferase family 4 protein [Vibrio cyclitrophicus]NOH45053.1 glycosyltransferase family 4 protein [Vibrio cyclitrophicus]